MFTFDTSVTSYQAISYDVAIWSQKSEKSVESGLPLTQTMCKLRATNPLDVELACNVRPTLQPEYHFARDPKFHLDFPEPSNVKPPSESSQLSDIFGRRPIIILAIAAFLGGVVICALGPSFLIAIAGCVISGIDGGGITF
ncbi:hypothetical protein BC936DRAFT_146830 [Jimgerdemannia flammicorona]|uniref:Major facilitator superfamily (MFS) profile domain-containing protein n=1 Tax=Jimgerdemannia flammicorona TaxID=994334 RepID=A0A433D6Q3_9FUNG|nr:hypothetical protein BC936DRAFT_146830 [Jimgerdemannia flammicorona]